METYVLEGVCTAQSSISHNGGERNGITTQLRREKFVLPNGKVVLIPVISGNSVRGTLRNIAAREALTDKAGEKTQVNADVFNLLFSGGSLESVGDKNLDIGMVRELKARVPILSVFGASIGNIMLPGKVDIGKMIPICSETLPFISEEYYKGREVKTIWDYCQTEMYVRKDDTKNDNLRPFIKEEDAVEAKGNQMQYNLETFAAGTRFFWRICLKDTTEAETGAFLSTLKAWIDSSSQIGGNARVGHGKLKVELKEKDVINSDLKFENFDFVKYTKSAEKENVAEFLKKGDVGTLFVKK